MNLDNLLSQHRARFVPMFAPPLDTSNTVAMDLSAANNEFDGLDEAGLDAAILSKLAGPGVLAGVGGYLENRSLYRETDLFEGDAERCIHIGVDVFVESGTVFMAPLDGVVHSFANRQVSGDYGPVIILRHELDGVGFHTLYGHLDETSLEGLREGMPVGAGERLGAIGARPGNGNWPPHLHFQVIGDMQGMHGDYPGVVCRSDLDFYRRNCPNPIALLLTDA